MLEGGASTTGGGPTDDPFQARDQGIVPEGRGLNTTLLRVGGALLLFLGRQGVAEAFETQAVELGKGGKRC